MFITDINNWTSKFGKAYLVAAYTCKTKDRIKLIEYYNLYNRVFTEDLNIASFEYERYLDILDAHIRDDKIQAGFIAIVETNLLLGGSALKQVKVLTYKDIIKPFTLNGPNKDNQILEKIKVDNASHTSAPPIHLENIISPTFTTLFEWSGSQSNST